MGWTSWDKILDWPSSPSSFKNCRMQTKTLTIRFVASLWSVSISFYLSLQSKLTNNKRNERVKVVRDVIVGRYGQIRQNSIHHGQLFRIHRSAGLVLDKDPGIQLQELALRDLQHFALCEKLEQQPEKRKQRIASKGSGFELLCVTFLLQNQTSTKNWTSSFQQSRNLFVSTRVNRQKQEFYKCTESKQRSK